MVCAGSGRLPGPPRRSSGGRSGRRCDGHRTGPVTWRPVPRPGSQAAVGSIADDLRPGEKQRMAAGMGDALVIIAGTAWFVVPGLLIGAALGVRGWVVLGIAPPLTMGVAATAAQVSTVSGIAWSPLLVAGVVVVLAALLAVAAHSWRPVSVVPDSSTAAGTRWTWWQHAGIAAALVVTGVLGLRNTYRATGGFEQVNQTWDALFHAGAIRFIVDVGDPAPAALGAIAAQASPDFFTPNTYHATAALVMMSSGAPVMVVINVLAGLLPLLLGLGVVALVRATTGRPAHALCGAFFAAVVVAVPYHMIGYGALIPYGTTLVMLAGMLALFATVFAEPGWRLGIALGIALAGLLSAHPQVAFLAVVIAVVQFGWHVARTRRTSGALWLTVAVSLVTFAAVGAPVLLATLRTASGAAGIDWPAYTSAGGALGDLLLFNAASQYPQWWLAPLMLLGIFTVLAGGADPALRPFVAAAAAIAGLYILAGAYDTPLSLAITSLWWNDRHRLAAAFAVLGILFAAVGAVWLRDRIVTVAGRMGPLRPSGRVAPASLLVLGLAAFFVVTGGGYAAATQSGLAAGYGTTPTLSDQERTGLAEVNRIVQNGGGGEVMNDPHDGCGWAYALYGTDVVFPTPLTGPFDWANLGYDRMRLYERFDELDIDPQIASDGEQLDVRWAVLCTGFIRDWQSRAPGLMDLNQMPSAELVFSNGAVQLFRIDEPGAGSAAG